MEWRDKYVLNAWGLTILIFKVAQGVMHTMVLTALNELLKNWDIGANILNSCFFFCTELEIQEATNWYNNF